MNDIEKIIEKIKEETRPTEDEIKKIKYVIEKCKHIIHRCIDAVRINGKKVNAEIVLTGSVAKGTMIRGNHDIDLFLLIKNDISIDKNTVNTMAEYIRKYVKWVEINYAQHPYIRVGINGYKIDIVPAYAVKHAGLKRSAVDRTVFHTKYVLSHLSDTQKDDVRVLKQFMKGANIYGAEIKVEGVSGYLCELLIIAYSNFINTVKNMAKWRAPVIIDVSNHYRENDDKDIYKDLIERFKGPLIVIDPTDKHRNVASALSEENFKKIIKYSNAFLKNPSKTYFTIKEDTALKYTNNLKRKYKHKLGKNAFIISISIGLPYANEEANWGKAKSIGRKVAKAIETAGIEINEYKVFVDTKIRIILSTKDIKLPKTCKKIGPKKEMKEHVKRFIDMHKKKHKLKRCKIKLVGGKYIAYCTVEEDKRDIVSNVIRPFVKNMIKGLGVRLSIKTKRIA